jgi:hypothetical protein
MPTFSRSSGVRVTTSNAIAVGEISTDASMPRRGRSRRLFSPVPMPGAAEGADVEGADLLSALAAQEITIVDEVQLQPSLEAVPPTRRRGGGPSEAESATIELDLAADEEAMVLLEQDGFYSWHLTPQIEQSQLPPSRGRRGFAPAAKTARFTVEFQRETQETAATQQRGFVKDLVIAKARAIVLKFVAQFAVGKAMEFLERKVQRGLVVMDSDEPQRWRPVESLAALDLPKERPARLLLFVHGTFSSTIGSFGGLGATPWGRAFLEAARANYDAVIGFDHATLSEDPLANAKDLMQRLGLGTSLQKARIDAISYSRGGLVLRSFLEYLLPGSTAEIEIGRTIFVGVVNSGTLLARAENWRTFIDLYTNLAAAACRAVALFPQVAFGALLTREIIQTVGAFAKFLAADAVTRGGIPGLAAMDPDGKFIRELNETQPGQITPSASQFYAVLSEFSPRLVPETANELPRQLVLLLANGLMDRLMGEANDLVVNTTSMTAIDPEAGNFIKDKLDFGANGVIYHTNYFLQPQAANAATRWLQLQAPEVAMPARRRSFAHTGTASRLDVPVQVDTDVLILRADELADDAASAIKRAEPSYVVIERAHAGETLRYAYPAEEVITRAQESVRPGAPTPTLLEALALHEYQSSPAHPIRSLPPSVMRSAHPTTERIVATEGDKVVGVVPEETKPFTTQELLAMAAQASTPTTDVDRIVRRRGLPTFATETAGPAAALASAAEPRIAPAPDMEVAKATCHFRAEMEEELELAKVGTVQVTISREAIERLTGPAAAAGTGDVDPTRKLILQLLPKVNFDAVGETRLELDVPAAGEPKQCYFDVQPTNEGGGEIWVVVRQGQVPLVNLILRPRIVRQHQGPVRRIDAPATTTEAPALTEPLHQLSIFEIKKGDDTCYRFEFDSPPLNLKCLYDSRTLLGDRNTYVNNLYKEIENRWVSNRDDASGFNDDLRAFGGQLWDELIPAELQTALWQHRDNIRSIMVFSEEPFVPWELVHMKEPGKSLGAEPLFFAQKGIVRWLHNFGYPPQKLSLRPGRCRYVIPDYPHPKYRLPETAEEAEFLRQKFAATAVDPQLNSVRTLLSEGGAFDLLHFAGHGIAEHEDIANAQFMLQGRVEGGNYMSAYLSATTVEQFARLENADGTRAMIVLNACQAGRAGYKLSGIGGFARAFLTGKAGVFVGALWSVGDQPARTFTEELYNQLLAGRRLAEAAIAARETARNAGEATWLAYVIYGHPHTIVGPKP